MTCFGRFVDRVDLALPGGKDQMRRGARPFSVPYYAREEPAAACANLRPLAPKDLEEEEVGGAYRLEALPGPSAPVAWEADPWELVTL